MEVTFKAKLGTLLNYSMKEVFLFWVKQQYNLMKEVFLFWVKQGKF